MIKRRHFPGLLAGAAVMGAQAVEGAARDRLFRFRIELRYLYPTYPWCSPTSTSFRLQGGPSL